MHKSIFEGLFIFSFYLLYIYLFINIIFYM